MKLFRRNPPALWALALLFGAGAVNANEFDPLNPAELNLAKQLSIPTVTAARRSSGTVTGSLMPVVERLLVERRPSDKNQPGQRLADVYDYDYSADETIHSIIDLKTQKLVSSKRVQQLQLPLTENEIARATQMIFADPEVLAPLQAEFRRISGQQLTSANQLNVKAFTFTSDTLPEGLNAASQQCGVQRCAQVLLYTHESVVFEISPIVNLSVGMVTQNIGF